MAPMVRPVAHATHARGSQYVVVIPLSRLDPRRLAARQRGWLAMAFVLFASTVVAAPATPQSSSDARRSTAATTAAPPALVSPSAATPAATITPGFDATGRSLETPTAGETPFEIPSPTPTPTPTPSPSPTPPCEGTCTTVPLPQLGPTPNPAAAAAFRLHVPIFEYHRVKPFDGEGGYSRSLITPPPVFDAQLTALAAAGWKTITMGELGDDLRLGIVPPPKTFVITLDDGYEDGYQNAYPILVAHGFTATFFVIAGRIGTEGYLTPFEIKRLAFYGFEIGNHSFSHRDLAALPPEQLTRETRDASAVIANITGSWPRSFSYPKGFTSAVVVGFLNTCPGLTTAVVQGGSLRQTWTNRWRLSRIRVGPDTYPSDLVDRASRY